MVYLLGTDLSEKALFREVLSHFCTGVVVVAAMDETGEPVGMTCQSFSSLSLEPPLVLFCPAKSSTTWPRIRSIGRFAISILGEGQLEVCRQFARSGTDKFAGVDWTTSPGGSPYISGAVAYLDCSLVTTYDGGDHDIALGSVESLELGAEGLPPLLFHKSGFTSLVA